MLALHINLKSGNITEKEYDVSGIIELGVELHTKKRTYSKETPLFVMGKGPFTDTGLPGTHRLTFVFRSPMTGGLHVSSMGGAAWYFKRTGYDALVLEGQADSPTAVILNGQDVFTHNVEDVGNLLRQGLRAFTEKLASETDFPARIVAGGLAALTTPLGALYSADIRNGKVVGGSEDYAARGGGGSALFQHNVAAVVFGGNPSPQKPDGKAMKAVEEANGKPYMQAIMDATVKYRFDPKLNTGGTFGGNYPHLQVYTPMFNFSMIYLPREERERLWKELMGDRWWARFNREVINVKAFKTCGEPCPVACKKVWNGMKVDYEPFEACGPLSWIFDFDQTARLVNRVDELGYDAIEFGSTLAWIIENVKEGGIPAGDVGFRGWNSEELTSFGIKLAEALATGNAEVFRALREGKRRGGELLETIYGEGIRDRAVYVPYGKEGYMTPTMYWAIGNYVPLPVPGRYWTYYKFAVFLEPEELADKSFSRAVAEMWIDNLGMCRFHRGWFEKSLPGLMEAVSMDCDLEKRGNRIMKKIVRYNEKAGAIPQFWETQRVKDLVKMGAKEFGSEEWAKKFEKEEGLKEYWDRFHERFYSHLR